MAGPKFPRLLLWYLQILVFTFHTAQALHLYVDSGTPTCFIQQLKSDQLLIGKYKIEIRDPYTALFYPPSDHVGAMIDVYLENQRLVHQRGSASGQFKFLAVDSGQHRVCLVPKTFETPSVVGPDFTRARVTVFIDPVDHELEVPDNSLVGEVRRLKNKLVGIQREHEAIREKEVCFGELSERTGNTLVYWMRVQGVVSAVVWGYQMLTMWRMKVKVE
ncbi:uncharacterized protein CANTADRAFT_8361 [Suhomyces tanzawaensis NRRL Y-17324]|uniref:GOLD domain-containing protein n=1 Tax=Suhomyces tanzawaensis NRRL Y-17324 TaxID=984487 RepID=A0A1E4SB71_9ASCO|nr:uncharacterized protein CANTADRAFT_8361 [Suhomyces tanzawaensis NRRL Y-17324]ODV76764.1 hypothetical protein CANTADRAFT_8361 [Suhomyces tanzawaensis NRRL Y-17324]